MTDSLTAYRTASSETLHADADCPNLSTAIQIVTTDPTEHDDPPTCSDCVGGFSTPDDAIPAAIPCPCGFGFATRRQTPTTQTIGNGRVERHYHYRHEGCPFGGTLVAIDGTPKRASGPVFEPERFGVTPRRTGAAAD